MTDESCEVKQGMQICTVAKIKDFTVTTEPTVPMSLTVLFVLLAFLSSALFDLDTNTALPLAFLAVMLHVVATTLHHVGHMIASRRTGYPMSGIHFNYVLARSLYPRNEPDLPAQVHIHRALGGPMMSTLVAIVGVILALAVGDSLLQYPLFFLAADSFFVYTLGAFMPLGFTDGSTILRWRKKR